MPATRFSFGAHRPTRSLSHFSVSVRTPEVRLDYTALARSSFDAMCDALAALGNDTAIRASVKPLRH